MDCYKWIKEYDPTRPVQYERGEHGVNTDIVGATGWMALQPPYVKEYEPQGCLEYYASGTGICNRAKELIRANKSYRGELRQMPISRLTTKHIFKAYATGDVIARQVIDKAVEMWGMASANMVSLLNPDLLALADYVVRSRRDEKAPARPSSVVKLGADGTVKILRE